MPELRRIAIIGAGPMGCSLAVVCARTTPTVLVVRNADRLTRIREQGIGLGGELDYFAKPDVVSTIEDLKQFDDLEEAGPHISSMAKDVRTGLETEIDQLNRQIVEKAAKHNISVPTHVAVLALIETYAWKTKQRG